MANQKTGSRITVNQLFEALKDKLALTWVGGRQSAQREFVRGSGRPAAGIVSYFNLIHSNEVQILGPIELNYLNNLNKKNYRDAVVKLFSPATVAVIVVDGQQAPEQFLSMAEQQNISLLASDAKGEEVIEGVRYCLAQLLAEKTNLHGVFMEVISIGVLLAGESGVGKSELALELVTRGHRLIADDAPLFARIAPDIIVGTSPPIIQDFLEVRGLGVLNIRLMYGDSAIKASKYLKLIINLKHADTGAQTERQLETPSETCQVLGMAIPTFTVPVAPGRNLAVLVEAAVRNYALRINNYYADHDIISRHNRALQKNDIYHH